MAGVMVMRWRDASIFGWGEVCHVDRWRRSSGLRLASKGKAVDFTDPVMVTRILGANGLSHHRDPYSAGRRPPWGDP